jgi:hypothetical protein
MRSCDTLKPGTLILADISLHCYVYLKKTPNEDGRKVSKLYMSSLQLTTMLERRDTRHEVDVLKE